MSSEGGDSRRGRVLLTVPDMRPCSSPWREVLAVAQYLSRQHFELVICSLREDGVVEGRAELERLGVPSFVARFRPRGRSPRHFVQSLRDQSGITAQGPFDIQHSMDFTSSPFEALMARHYRRAFVFSQRNMNHNGSRCLLKYRARLARRVFCISQSVQDLMRDMGVSLDKLVLARLGIDYDKIPWADPALRDGQPRTLLCVGQISRLKRQEDAIRVLAQLASEIRDLRLQLAGPVMDASYQHKLERLAGALGVRDRVEFLGLRTDVLALMRAATVLVHCSASEALGWVILEAMAVGLPVVAPAIEGPLEVIEHGRNGFLVPSGDIQAYVTTLHHLLCSPDLGSRVSAQARKTVEQKFSAKSMVPVLEREYLHLMEIPTRAGAPASSPTPPRPSTPGGSCR